MLLVHEKGLRLVKLSVKELELGLSQSLSIVLVVVLLVVDVLGNVVDLALPALNGCIELHGLLSCVLQVLLEVSDLTRKLALRGTILSVLLLDLGEVLELDSLSLEDTPLHVLDQLLLLLTEEFILELHPMNFLLHGDDLSLTNGWVKSVLHLFLKLILALPEEDLLFSLDYFDQDITLLLFELGDLVLKLDRLILHLLKLLLELHLDVEVVSRELLLATVVLIDLAVELVHLEDLVLLGHFQLSDLLVVVLDLRVDSNFLLVKDGFLSSQIVVLAIDLVLLLLTLDKLDLVGNPVLLNVGCVIVDFLNLLLDVVTVVFDGSDELITISTALKVGTLTVQTIDLKGLLLDVQQSALDLLLNILDISLLRLQLINQIVKLLLQHLVLRGRVEVIKTYTRDLISVVLDLDLFLGDVLVCHLCLLEEIGRGLLDRLLLTGVGDDIIPDSLGLGMQLHDTLVKDVVLRLHIGLFLVHASRLKLRLLQRVLEHDFLLVELLFLSLELLHPCRQEFDLLLALVKLIMKVFTRLLLFLGLVANTADLGLDLEDLVITLSDEVLDGLESLVTLLHAKETLLPVLKQSLLAHNDSLNLNSSFFECVPGSGRFFFL